MFSRHYSENSVNNQWNRIQIDQIILSCLLIKVSWFMTGFRIYAAKIFILATEQLNFWRQNLVIWFSAHWSSKVNDQSNMFVLFYIMSWYDLFILMQIWKAVLVQEVSLSLSEDISPKV